VIGFNPPALARDSPMSKDLPLSFKDVLRQMEERALKAQTGLPSCILLTPVVGPVGEVESDAVVLVRIVTVYRSGSDNWIQQNEGRICHQNHS